MKLVGILLCAGAGTRFGGDKLLAQLPDGRAMAQVVCANLRAGMGDVIAVVRPNDAALTQVLRGQGVRVIECAEAEAGMGASLACGVRAAPDADGWLIALGDMPWIRAATIQALAAALTAGASIVVPSYAGKRGHPVGFARQHYAALAALSGDRGARNLLNDKNAVTWLDCDDPGILRDVDTRDDLV